MTGASDGILDRVPILFLVVVVVVVVTTTYRRQCSAAEFLDYYYG